MDHNDKVKAEQAHSTLKAFTNQFGEDDICKDALLDVILEAIYGEATDDMAISGETRQEAGEDSQLSRPGQMPTYKIE